MFKKIIASALTSVSLLTLSANTTLAQPPQRFIYRKTLYPSNCSVFIKGNKFTCNYVVMGAFSNASANIKLCSVDNCLILVLSAHQLMSGAKGRDFYIRRMAWQKSNSIDYSWRTSMQCGIRSNEMSCMGRLANGNSISIYVD